MPTDVFISYASKNRPIADAVCHFLEERSIRCWIAPRDIPEGREWAAAIVDAIPASRVVVLIFSSHANESPFVRREILLAVNREVVIIPFRIENVFPEKAMELFISANHWLDAITPPVERHLSRLAASVASLLAGDVDSRFSHDPVREIEALAGRWTKSGCPYQQLEEISKKMQLFLREPPTDLVFKDEDTLLMLMLAAIHFGANWLYWVRKNSGSRAAVRQLLGLLRISYLRPRLRALYALEQFAPELVAGEIRNLDRELSRGSRALLEKYVQTQNVEGYLEKLRNGDDPELCLKAGAVLKEIRRFRGKTGAAEPQNELPIV